MRPSRLSRNELWELKRSIGLIKKRKSKIKVMKTPPAEVAFDYPFELVIARTGHYYMSQQSLNEWEREHPRMRGRLAARGIGIIGIDSKTVKIVYHGSRYLHSN